MEYIRGGHRKQIITKKVTGRSRRQRERGEGIAVPTKLIVI